MANFEHPFNSLTGQSDMASIQRTLVYVPVCLVSIINICVFIVRSDTVTSVSKFSQLVDACLPYIPDFVFNFSLRLPIYLRSGCSRSTAKLQMNWAGS